MTKRQILDKFLRKGFLNKGLFPTGGSCTYVQINNSIGVKCYPLDKKNRDFSFKYQKFLNKLSLAPKTFFKFELFSPFEKNLKIYCYVTQHAKKCDKGVFKKLKKEFAYILEKNGFSSADLFQRNCGIINRKMVLIDCDVNTLTW